MRPQKEDWSERAEYEEYYQDRQIFDGQMEIRRALSRRERELDSNQVLEVQDLEELLED